MQEIQLSNGLKISNLCYGTGIVYTYRYGNFNVVNSIKYWMKNFLINRRQYKKDKAITQVIDVAMQKGCCMFDTSRAYCGAEYALGKTLKKYNRKDYVLVTKLMNQDQYKGNVREALKKSLEELNEEYIDLYLMHWPVTEKYIGCWKQMEQLYKEGLCKAIGVCNFNVHHLEELEKHAEIMPMVNQIECHPLFTQVELREYCMKKDIQVMAYTSTGRMDERLRKTCLIPISKKYQKSMAQIILRWHQQIGNIPIVNSYNVNHLVENIDIKDFSLTEEEIDQINKININSRLRYDPDNCDFRQL